MIGLFSSKLKVLCSCDYIIECFYLVHLSFRCRLHIQSSTVGYSVQNKMTGENDQCRQAQGCTITSKKDSKQIMKAAAWYGNKDIWIIERPRPLITDPNDVILKVTSTAICGSDLVCF